MRVRLAVFALSAFLSVAAGAQTTEGEDARRRLVEQKLRLVETLLNAPATRNAATRGADAKALVDSASRGLDDARSALTGGNSEDAAKLADAAFRALMSSVLTASVMSMANLMTLYGLPSVSKMGLYDAWIHTSRPPLPKRLNRAAWNRPAASSSQNRLYSALAA